MIHGTYSVPRVPEESVCRTSKDYKFTDIGIYKIHSTSLMPNIPFEEESTQPFEIDSSIFLNDEETKLEFEETLDCQNFMTAKFIGRAPLEWYGENDDTKMGRQFVMVCRKGNTGAQYRIFGTEDAIRGYNRNANENIMMPGGGENVDK